MKIRIVAILITFCLLLSGCVNTQASGVPQDFKPVSMTLDGKYSAVFNEDLAVNFQKTVLNTMQPVEKQEVGEEYRFTLAEQPERCIENINLRFLQRRNYSKAKWDVTA